MCEKRIQFKDKNGQLHDYRVVLMLKDEKTEKQYLVYTDGAYTGAHEKHLHAARFIPADNQSAILMPIETDEEMAMIEIRLNEIE